MPNEKHSLKDVVTEMEQTSAAVTNSVIKDISSAFKQSLDERRVKIPEDIFKEKFYPHLKQMAEHPDSPVVTQWIHYVGGVYKEADIIDKNGNVIDTVPSIIARPNVDQKLSDVDFSKISARYKLKDNRLPAEAINFLATQLSNLPGGVSGDTAHGANRWKQLISKYDDMSPVSDSNEETGLDKKFTDTVDYNYDD